MARPNSKATNGSAANLGFEAKLWLAADKLRNKMDAAEYKHFIHHLAPHGMAGFVLAPGRYVGAEEVEDDGEPFAEKMPRLVAELNAQFAESTKLEQAIRKNLKGLGYA